MNRKFWVIGNWKSNKTFADAIGWCKEFSTLWKKQPVNLQKIKVILCPAAIHLVQLQNIIKELQLPITLGIQNISPFKEGAFTGEINAQQVIGLISFAIVGHSERRKYFQESDQLLDEKVKHLTSAGIEPVYCLQNDQQAFPDKCNFIAYEPVWAIGTGKPDTSENANRVAMIIKSRAKHTIKVIYGGSVTELNVSEYSQQSDIDGVLPGGASLSAATFYHLLQNVGQI